MHEYTPLALEDAPRVPFKFDGRILFFSSGYELVHLTLQSGEGMEMHSQPFNVVFFILEGTGTLTIEDREIHVKENCVISVGAGLMRAWKNSGNGQVRILVNKLIGQ